MAYRRRRSSYGRSRYTRGRSYSRFRTGRRPAYRTLRRRGRYRGTGRVRGSTVRLVIQTPSDMLPPRPQAGQFARIRRRARF